MSNPNVGTLIKKYAPSETPHVSTFGGLVGPKGYEKTPLPSELRSLAEAVVHAEDKLRELLDATHVNVAPSTEWISDPWLNGGRSELEENLELAKITVGHYNILQQALLAAIKDHVSAPSDTQLYFLRDNKTGEYIIAWNTSKQD